MFKKVALEELELNPFDAIGRKWMLITAGTRENCNTMTASWGGLGVLWNRKVATAYIRPQRYTMEFVEKQPCFTLSFFGEEYRQALALCGRVSGRDVNKIQECGFTVAEGQGGAPYFEQADLVLVCRKLYADTIKPGCFIDAACDATCYPEHDYHTFYIGEVVEALTREI